MPPLTTTWGSVGGVVYFALQAASSLMSMVGLAAGVPENLITPVIVAPPAGAAVGAAGGVAAAPGAGVAPFSLPQATSTRTALKIGYRIIPPRWSRRRGGVARAASLDGWRTTPAPPWAVRRGSVEATRSGASPLQG